MNYLIWFYFINFDSEMCNSLIKFSYLNFAMKSLHCVYKMYQLLKTTRINTADDNIRKNMIWQQHTVQLILVKCTFSAFVLGIYDSNLTPSRRTNEEIVWIEQNTVQVPNRICFWLEYFVMSLLQLKSSNKKLFHLRF